MADLPARLSVNVVITAVVALLLGPFAVPGLGSLAEDVAAPVVAGTASGAEPGAAGDAEDAQRLHRHLMPCRLPVIATQPESGEVESGEGAKLAVVVSGVAAPTYQWYLGSSGDTSSLIAGATSSSYTTPVLTAATRFWVRVANGCGYADSLTAVVTVTGAPEPQITIYLGPGSTIPLDLVRIHAGTPFMMGAPSGERGSDSYEMPQHQVTIAEDYYLGKSEVTQAQWQAVMGTNPSSYSGCGGTCPVEQVSWNDIAGAGGFIEKLNQAQSTTKFRLPTEAEWEYAARAGTTTEFSFSVPAGWDMGCVSFPAAEPYLWWCGDTSPDGTKPVGQKLANPWGLFDMHGNVWEWVQDWWHDTYTGAPTDGRAWVVPSGSSRVLRGGGWYNAALYCRSARRGNYGGEGPGYGDFGFRLARSQ